MRNKKKHFNFIALYSFTTNRHMEDFKFVYDFIISEATAWPMIHIFTPALLTIYIQFDIWKLISIIYLFESLEYIISLMPGLEKWKESTNADNLVSDIIMGLIGFTAVFILQKIIQDKQKIPLWCRLIHIIGVPALHALLWQTLDMNQPETEILSMIVYASIMIISTIIIGAVFKSNILLVWSIISTISMISNIITFKLVGQGTAPISLITLSVVMLLVIKYRIIFKRWLPNPKYIGFADGLTPNTNPENNLNF